MKNLYYTNNHLFSYGTNVVGVIGARGIGKTYSTQIYTLKRFFRKGFVFAWLRDNEKSVDALCSNNANKFFSAIKNDRRINKYLKDAKIQCKDGVLTYNGKLMGYIMACSTFYKLKGSAFNEVRTIVYDEFIAEKVQVSRGDRAYEFMNMVQTIGRLRNDYKIIMLANALNKGDEILYNLGITINKGFGFYVNRKKSVCIHYANNNPIFIEETLKSISGKLMQDSDYDENLINNGFQETKINIYEKKPRNAKVLLILKINDYNIINFMIKDNEMYVGITDDGETYLNKRFTSDFNLVGIKYRLIPKEALDGLKNTIASGLVKFQNERAYQLCLEGLKIPKKK